MLNVFLSFLTLNVRNWKVKHHSPSLTYWHAFLISMSQYWCHLGCLWLHLHRITTVNTELLFALEKRNQTVWGGKENRAETKHKHRDDKWFNLLCLRESTAVHSCLLSTQPSLSPYSHSFLLCPLPCTQFFLSAVKHDGLFQGVMLPWRCLARYRLGRLRHFLSFTLFFLWSTSSIREGRGGRVEKTQPSSDREGALQ